MTGGYFKQFALFGIIDTCNLVRSCLRTKPSGGLVAPVPTSLPEFETRQKLTTQVFIWLYFLIDYYIATIWNNVISGFWKYPCLG